MDRVLKLLDEAKMRCNPQPGQPFSDAKFAKCLRVTPQALSNWRTGANYPDAVACARLAELLERPLAEVLGIVGEARARSTAEKSVWRRLAASAAALLAAFAGVGATTLPADAVAASRASVEAPAIYIMRTLGRWLRRRRPIQVRSDQVRPRWAFSPG